MREEEHSSHCQHMFLVSKMSVDLLWWCVADSLATAQQA